MAKSVAQETISPGHRIYGRSSIIALASIYQNVAESTGQSGETRRWVAVYMRRQATGSREVPSASQGAYRIEAVYTDNSTEDLIDSDSPGTSPVETTAKWFVSDDAGQLDPITQTSITTSINPTATALASTRQRLGLSATKTPKEIKVYWTNN